jgi:hypothetical protein
LPGWNSGGLRDSPIGEGEDCRRMQAMERADQLPPEDFEAVERAAFLAA